MKHFIKIMIVFATLSMTATFSYSSFAACPTPSVPAALFFYDLYGCSKVEPTEQLAYLKDTYFRLFWAANVLQYIYQSRHPDGERDTLGGPEDNTSQDIAIQITTWIENMKKCENFFNASYNKVRYDYSSATCPVCPACPVSPTCAACPTCPESPSPGLKLEQHPKIPAAVPPIPK